MLEILDSRQRPQCLNLPVPLHRDDSHPLHSCCSHWFPPRNKGFCKGRMPRPIQVSTSSAVTLTAAEETMSSSYHSLLGTYVPCHRSVSLLQCWQWTLTPALIPFSSAWLAGQAYCGSMSTVVLWQAQLALQHSISAQCTRWFCLTI